MPYCGPVCAVPSCASSPVVGFGSAGLGCGGLGYGVGLGLGYGYGFGRGLGLGRGFGSGSGYGWGGWGHGGAINADNLGVLAGVQPSPVNQLPPSECVIRPPPCVVTLPGPVMSATCEPLAVGGYSPCAPSGSGYSGWSGGRLGLTGRRCSIC